MLHAGDLSLDRERRQATVRGERVELTKQEFDLLYLLASRPGAVFTRAALLEEVWSDDTYVTDRTVDTVIFREGAIQLVLPVTESLDGYAATYRIAMRPGVSRVIPFGRRGGRT